jgi:thiol-disulfide isomerase/thioredoxin
VSFLGQWALLKTGLKDATGEAILEEAEFDYQFTIKDMAGNRINASQFKDKVIFLNLWATWCGPCRAEMEGIQRLYANTHNDKIVFLMLSIDADKDQAKIIAYLKKKAFTFPVYQPSGTLPSLLDVPSIPTTFIISRKGKIIKKEVGSMRYDTPKFQKFLNDLSK